MSEAVKNLTKAVIEKNETDISDNLQFLLTQKDTNLSTVDLFKDLLKFDNNKSIIKHTAELIAELARIESNREICTDRKLLEDLINLLDNEDADIILQSIRAIGNICYENEKACTNIYLIGTNKILAILKQYGSGDSDTDKIITTKTSGLLVNLFTLNVEVMKVSIQNGLMPIVEDILVKYSKQFDSSEALLTFQISIVNLVENYLDGYNAVFTHSLCKALIDIFKQSEIPEISIPCLEIFYGLCEQEEIKTIFAKEGVCELLVELIEKYKEKFNDEDSRDALRLACDFIVVVATGDDCMNLLYKNGQGLLYKKTLALLESDDKDLLSTGILAIGNFARKDTHCIEMVNDGLSKKLIDMLKKYNTSTKLEDVKVQHALLSVLKNLLIPQQNKAKVIEEGLIEVIYPMIQIDQFFVVFKLLGTFRMAIEGQESTALDILSRKDFIERLVHWCYNSDHLGVRGEVPRLISWLVKSCHSVKPFYLLLEVPDSIKCLVEMISSNHAVMQNEAFYALSLLYVGLSSQNCEDSVNKFNKALINADMVKNLHFILTKYADKMDTPTIENLLALLEYICKSEEIVDHFKKIELHTPLIKLYSNPNILKLDKLDSIKSLLCD
ncbi:unnamed protein product [Diabrotica balteata]|uniref:Rap1 GTPase-GDP dissociation stimulator 1-B n=1 Tax=Diabrotica balteata TaxID=107213 RepID=A0A9N9SYH0_DIABA|nr:unnamed protein product [Diabrotica balteata]